LFESIQEERIDPKLMGQPAPAQHRQTTAFEASNTQTLFTEATPLPPISSLFENAIWYRIDGKLSPLLDSDTPRPQSASEGYTIDKNGPEKRYAHASISTSIKAEKNHRVCEALMAAMPPQQKVHEALKKYSPVWAYLMNAIHGRSTVSEDLSLQAFFQKAIVQHDPVSIGKVVQMVATVMDPSTYERLLLLVDELIIYDNEYMATIGGLECALFQGTLFADIGQTRRSW
jgi:hypothetical protein